MNYHNIYNQIIEHSKLRNLEGYKEKHHILPKSLGGTNNKENIVCLTAREHFICHYLLTKMYPVYTTEWYKMISAFSMMKYKNSNQMRYFNSRLYESSKLNFSIVQSYNQSGSNNSQYGTRWIYNTDIQTSMRISKTDTLPDGWSEGRVLNFSKLEEQQLKKENKEKAREQSEIKSREYIINLVNVFIESEYTSLNQFCNNVYERSLESFSKRLINHLPGYKNISKRGELNIKEKLKDIIKNQ